MSDTDPKPDWLEASTSIDKESWRPRTRLPAFAAQSRPRWSDGYVSVGAPGLSRARVAGVLGIN